MKARPTAAQPHGEPNQYEGRRQQGERDARDHKIEDAFSGRQSARELLSRRRRVWPYEGKYGCVLRYNDRSRRASFRTSRPQLSGKPYAHHHPHAQLGNSLPARIKVSNFRMQRGREKFVTALTRHTMRERRGQDSTR